MAQRELVAGVFSSPPVRVHVYPSSGAHVFIGADGAGCWSDPDGNVLVYTLADAKALLMAHGYALDEETMMVRDPRADRPKAPEWTRPTEEAIRYVLTGLGISEGALPAIEQLVDADFDEQERTYTATLGTAAQALSQEAHDAQVAAAEAAQAAAEAAQAAAEAAQAAEKAAQDARLAESTAATAAAPAKRKRK